MEEHKKNLDDINPNFLNPPTLKTLVEIKTDFPKIYEELLTMNTKVTMMGAPMTTSLLMIQC